jgi:hypothetical protein
MIQNVDSVIRGVPEDKREFIMKELKKLHAHHYVTRSFYEVSLS